jgi:hypothetical protein
LQMLNQAPENQPLIKNLSSTFPCLCCNSEHFYLVQHICGLWLIRVPVRMWSSFPFSGMWYNCKWFNLDIAMPFSFQCFEPA